MQGTYNGSSKKFKYLFDHATEVEVSGLQQTGTAVATLTVDGQAYTVKVPGSGGVSCETLVSTGTKIAILTIGQDDYDFYCPVASEVEYTDLIDDELTVYESSGGQQTIVYNEPTYKIGEIDIDGVTTPIYAPPATAVVYESNINQGVVAGKLIVRTIANDSQDESDPAVVAKNEYEIIVPTGGGGGLVDDVRVNNVSVVTNKIANIDLTGYATDSELSDAVTTLQTNFQAGVDAIYNACVAKGSTPASHSLSDVIDAIYAIGGNLPHAQITSDNTIPMAFNSSVTEGNT